MSTKKPIMPDISGFSDFVIQMFKCMFKQSIKDIEDIRETTHKYGWNTEWKEAGISYYNSLDEGDTKKTVKLFMDFVEKNMWYYGEQDIGTNSTNNHSIDTSSINTHSIDTCEISGCPECYFGNNGAYSR